MNVTIGDVSECNPDSGQKDGNKEKQRLENSVFIDNPTQGVNTILTMNPPPPPLPGVFVFDRPKQLQQSSHHVDLTCNVNSDSYDMIQGGNVHSTSSFYPCTPTSVQSLEIGAISTSSGMCHIQSLQPVTVSSFEDSHIQSENKVYHQLNSISPNHYNLLEEPKFYHEMSPVSVTSSLPKEGYDSKEYEYLIPTTVVENPSNFCKTFQELKPLKHHRNENPKFATSKLYQQLCQPLNKEENRNQETEKAELRPLTVIELEQSSRNKTIQNTQQQYSNIQGVNQSKPTYPSSPIRTEQTYSSSPIRTEQTYPSSPIRTEQTYSSSPIRTEQTYSSSPIRTEQTYPSSPIRTEQTYASSPIRTEQTYSSSPIRTEQTYSSSPIRSEQTYSSSPIRTEQTYASSPIRTEQTYSSSPIITEYNKFQSPTRETVISKADSKLSVLSSQAKITPHTPYFQIGSSSKSQTGFKEGKIYLELRNPTIRSEILKSSAQHGHQPITPPKNKNKNLPSTLSTSFQVSPKSQKLPEFKLPGPYEFKLPQQISPNKIKLPKILGHNEYTSYESNRDPYFGNKMTSTSLLTSPSTLINKNTSFNGPRNKVALSLPKTPLCYGDPGVNSKVSQYSGSTAFVNSKSEQTVVQPTSSLDQKSLTSNDKTTPMSSHSKLLEELLKPKLSVNKSSDSHQEGQNPNSSLDNRNSQIVSTQSQDSKMIQGTSKVAQNVKHCSDFSSPSKANTQKPFYQNDQSKLSPTDTKTCSVFVGRPNQSKDFKVTLSKATTVHAHEALDRLENADLGTDDSSKLPGTKIKQTENQASLETNCTSKPTFFINLSAETINTAKMSDQNNQSQYFESSKSVETINTDKMSNRCNQSQSLESSKSVETINTDIMSNRCNQSQSLESSEVASVTTSYKDSMLVCTNQLTCKPQVNVDNTNDLDIVKQKLSKHVTISVSSNSQSLTEVNKKPQSLGTSNITQATFNSSNQSDQVIPSDKINMEGLGSRLSGNLSILSRQSVENMSARKVSSAPTAQVERICSVSSEPNDVKLNITNEKGRSLSILADLKVPMNTNVSTQATPVLIGRSCSVVMEDVLHDKKISRLVDGCVVKSLEGKASKNSSNDVISEKNLAQTLDASNISYRIEEPTSLEIKERANDNPEEKPRKKYARRIYPESGRRKLIGRKASWGLKELIRLEKRRYKKRKVKNLDLNEGSNESLNDSKNYSDKDSSKNNSKHTAQFDKFVPQNKNVSTIKRLKKDAYYKVGKRKYIKKGAVAGIGWIDKQYKPRKEYKLVDPLAEELISDDEGEAVFLGFDVDDDGEMILGFASDNDDEYDMSGVPEPNHRSVQSGPLSRLNTVSRLKLMFKCPKCSRIFNSQLQYKRHFKRFHLGGKIFRCNKCWKKFSSKAYLVRHVCKPEEENVSGKMYKCNTCTKGFESRRGLMTHEGSHKEKEEMDSISVKCYECDKCQHVFDSIHGLYIHEGRAHKGIRVEEKAYMLMPNRPSGKIYRCNKCRRRFKSMRAIKLHLVFAHALKGKKCNQCEKVFTSEHAVKVHICKTRKTHEEKEETPLEFVPDQVSGKSFEFNVFHKENECYHCQKVFKSEHALKVHKGKMKETHKEKEEIPFEFVPDQVSGKSFEFNEFHKENECNHCQKVFKSEHALKVHKGKMKETHKEEEEVPFEFVPDQVSGKSFEFNEFHKENECNHCQKVFKSEHALKVHKGKMKETHKEEEEIPFEFVPDQVSGKSFEFNEFHKENECNYCQKVFKSEHALKVHKGKMKETHKEEEEIPFEFVPDQVSGKSFEFNEFHKENECNHCQKVFKSKHALKVHKGKMKETHKEEEEIPFEFVPDQGSRKSFEFNEFHKENECNHCQKVFKSEHALKVHKGKMKETHKEEEEIPFEFVPDQVSGKSFEFNEFHKENECNHCQKVFKSKHALKVHKGKMKETHKEEEEIPFEFVPDQVSRKSFEFNEFHKENECNHCQKVFKSEHALKVHKGKMKETHKDKEEIPLEFVPDQVSGKSFEFNEFHKENECNHCQKVFKSEHALKVHKGKMRKTHKEKEDIPFEFVPDQVSGKSFEFNEFHKENECNHCQKVFKSEHALKVHKGKMRKTHKEIEEIPFEVAPNQVFGNICEFNKSQRLLKSELVVKILKGHVYKEKKHTTSELVSKQVSGKSYEFDKCQRSLKSDLAVKLNAEHSQEDELGILSKHMPNPISGRNYKCYKCKKIFKTRITAIIHAASVHSKKVAGNKPPIKYTDESYECPLCFKRYRSKGFAMIHIKYVHKEEKRELDLKWQSDRSTRDKCGEDKENLNDVTKIVTITTHNGGKRYKCSKCNAGFLTNCVARKHVKEMHDTMQSKIKVHSKMPNETFDHQEAVDLAARNAKEEDRNGEDINSTKDPLYLGQEMNNTGNIHQEPEINITFENRQLEIESRFSSQPELQESKHKIQGETLYQCEKCLRSFQKLANLQRHKLCHKEEDINMAFPCAYCNEKFSSRDSLHAHWSVHSEKKLYTCDICQSNFSALNSLKRHKVLHSGEKLFRCEICQKAFSLLSTLKTHLLIHTGMKKFECNICGKTFNRKDVLNTHQLVHTDEKKFKCDICQQTFRWRHAVKSHKLIYHSKEKPYVCQECGKSFSHPDSFKKHAEVHADRVFSCQICSKSFSRASALRAHTVTHTDLKPFKCEKCHEKFRSRNQLRSHQAVHSREKSFLCKFCNKTFKNRKQLCRHKQKVHFHTFSPKTAPSLPVDSATVSDAQVDNHQDQTEDVDDSDISYHFISLPDENVHNLRENIVPQSLF